MRIDIDIDMILYLIERIRVLIILEKKVGLLIIAEIELVVKFKEIYDIADQMVGLINIIHRVDALFVPFFNGLCRNLSYFSCTIPLLE